MKKKATITVETERLLVFRRSRLAVTRWCSDCGAEVEMIGVDEAATVTGLSERTIFRLGETGDLHFTETAEGKALFCVAPLLQQTESKSRKLLRSTETERNKS
ncbi:MAG TPA: hypothetical protein VIF81_06230 [Pyrinomonadaceae bacterium]|jgi:hypothetical protein